MCIVNDDCAIKNYIPSVGRRGLAGGILINKIACALSDKGWTLQDISSFINNILKDKKIKSVGVSMNEDNVELGKGVHGEPGSMILELNNKDYYNIVHKMLENLFEDVHVTSDNLIILLNNLGGHSPTELCTIQQEVVNQLKNYYTTYLTNRSVRIYCGTYLTSLNVKGFSLSILFGDQLIIECIDHNCDTDAWKPSYINLNTNIFQQVYVKNKHSIKLKDLEPTSPQLSGEGSKVR